MEFVLPLQTPTVVIDVKVKGAGQATDTIQVECKRYLLVEANKHKAEFATIAENNAKLSEQASESGTFWESPVLNEATEMKEFILKHIVDFKNVKGKDESGKIIKVASVKAQGSFQEYFDLLWSSFPYREALITSTLQAIQNTSNT